MLDGHVVVVAAGERATAAVVEGLVALGGDRDAVDRERQRFADGGDGQSLVAWPGWMASLGVHGSRSTQWSPSRSQMPELAFVADLEHVEVAVRAWPSRS